MSDQLQLRKTAMRDAVLAMRDAMTPESRSAASVTILGKIFAVPQYEMAKVVLAYIGFGTEIETPPFFERIIADGKIAVLPRVDKKSQSLVLHSVHGLSELRSSNWGIREPQMDAPTVSTRDIDFVLMPGVAFDRAGNRLGYGRGYYDRLLVDANPSLACVAAAFSCQIVTSVPFGATDRKVDSIITENETITATHDR